MHRYDWGAPAGGWPEFGPDGRIIRPVRCPVCGEVVAKASPGDDVTVREGASGEVVIDGRVVHTCGGVEGTAS